MIYQTNYFASTYNCNTYGSGAYAESGECVSTTTVTPNASLSYTGEQILLPGALGILLVASAVVMLVRSRKKAHNK